MFDYFKGYKHIKFDFAFWRWKCSKDSSEANDKRHLQLSRQLIWNNLILLKGTCEHKESDGINFQQVIYIRLGDKAWAEAKGQARQVYHHIKHQPKSWGKIQ